jgi:hypothetical protein
LRLSHLLSISLLISVEAHSPFVQCVAWASSPPSEVEGESDRILNVVATGGTDKVREANIAFSSVYANMGSFQRYSLLKSGDHRAIISLRESAQTIIHIAFVSGYQPRDSRYYSPYTTLLHRFIQNYVGELEDGNALGVLPLNRISFIVLPIRHFFSPVTFFELYRLYMLTIGILLKGPYSERGGGTKSPQAIPDLSKSSDDPGRRISV